MKKSFQFLFIFLAACSAPQVTVTSDVTTTSIPPPTQTPIPTPTVHPQILAIQEQIAQSDIYTLNADGQIEAQTPDGVTILPGILVSKDGTMTVTHEGEEFEADPKMLKVVDQRIIFRDNSIEPKTWIYDGEKLETREYTPPAEAGWVTYEESLSDVNFELDKERANEQAIYENFLSLLPNSLKKTPWNEAITKIVQEKHGLEIVANQTPDREKRVAFIQAFLIESGGIIDIYNPLNRETLEGVDMNLPFIHKSIEATEAPGSYTRVNGTTTPTGDKAIYGNLQVSKNGQITISLAHNSGVLQALLETTYKGYVSGPEIMESINFHIFLENFGAGYRKLPFTGRLTSDPSVYLFGNDIFQMKDDSEYLGLSWSKVKSGFLINK